MMEGGKNDCVETIIKYAFKWLFYWNFFSHLQTYECGDKYWHYHFWLYIFDKVSNGIYYYDKHSYLAENISCRHVNVQREKKIFFSITFSSKYCCSKIVCQHICVGSCWNGKWKLYVTCPLIFAIELKWVS